MSISSGDGIVSLEKLHTLLSGGGEYDELDFKLDWDLTQEHGKASAARCLASMASLPNGGYVVVGVNDDKVIIGIPEDRDLKLFDPANLGAMVNTYANIHLNSAVHSIDGKNVALIYSKRADFGLLVMKADSKPGRFRKGDILIRKNTSTQKISQDEYNRILHREIQRALREHETALIGLREKEYSKTQASYSLNKALSSFIANEAESAEYLLAEDALLSILVGALEESNEELGRIVKYTANWYVSNFGQDRMAAPRADKAFAVALMMESVGALALRADNFEGAKIVADVQVPVTENYTYSSWIRHGQVMLARARPSASNSGSDYFSVVDQAMGYVLRHSELMHDFSSTELAPYEKELVLDSLVRFDFIWNLIAQNRPNTAGYPSFIYYDADTLIPAIEMILENYKIMGYNSVEDAKADVSTLLYRSIKMMGSMRVLFSFSTHKLIQHFNLPQSKG